MPVSLDQFTQQLVAFDLLSADETSAILAKERIEPSSEDAEPFARLLIKQKKLTAFQAHQIYIGKGESLVMGNYLILDKLGQGGMGMVLKAEHRRMKRTVALKVLCPAFMKNSEMMRRFQREVEATARLEHPHIVTALDADVAHGTQFLVMQYIEGSNLSALVKRQGPLSIEKALDCLLQAARGLEYAHQRGVVHRDIKPANLLLDHQGTLKILDLGMARLDVADSGQDRLTDIGQIMGTVDYMAPEQAMDTRFADARADIYALGITLWYLLTGRPVYEGDTVVKKLMAHQNSPIPSLRGVCPQASPELEALFEKMVAKNRDSRYQNMSEVIAELERITSEADTKTLPLAAAPEDKRFSEFLGRIDTSNRPTVALKAAEMWPAARAAKPSANISFSQVDIDLSRQKFLVPSQTGGKSKPSPPRFRRWRKGSVWIASGSLAAVLTLTGLAFLVPAQDAAIRLEIEDPKTTVAIKGTDIVLEHADEGEAVRLASGEKTLIVQRDDIRFETKTLLFKPGELITIRVELQADQLEVRRGEKLLGLQKLPEPTETTRRDATGNQVVIKQKRFRPGEWEFLGTYESGAPIKSAFPKEK